MLGDSWRDHIGHKHAEVAEAERGKGRRARQDNVQLKMSEEVGEKQGMA